MADKKNTNSLNPRDKSANVHLDGAKESGNFKKDNSEVIKSAQRTMERGNSNRL